MTKDSTTSAIRQLPGRGMGWRRARLPHDATPLDRDEGVHSDKKRTEAQVTDMENEGGAVVRGHAESPSGATLPDDIARSASLAADHRA